MFCVITKYFYFRLKHRNAENSSEFFFLKRHIFNYKNKTETSVCLITLLDKT